MHEARCAQARAQRLVPGLVIVARFGGVRARAHHVPVTPLLQPRAATSSPACRPITWAQACWPPASTLLHPIPAPLPSIFRPLFPLSPTSAGLLTRLPVAPSIWLFNCHRLGSTQAPPLKPGRHAPEKDHAPTNLLSSTESRPSAELPHYIGLISPLTPPLRPSPNHHWQSSAPGPAPCPAPRSHCLRRCFWS